MYVVSRRGIGIESRVAYCFVFFSMVLAPILFASPLFASGGKAGRAAAGRSAEKNQKSRELEKEVNYWKKEAAECLTLRDEAKEEYEEKIKELERKYNFERCANEAQHKFFRQYTGKGTEIEFNYVIDDITDETSYVIVDKEEYQSLKDHGYTAMIHDKIYNPVQLVDKILELENLNKQLNDRILKLEKMTDGELRSCY